VRCVSGFKQFHLRVGEPGADEQVFKEVVDVHSVDESFAVVVQQFDCILDVDGLFVFDVFDEIRELAAQPGGGNFFDPRSYFGPHFPAGRIQI